MAIATTEAVASPPTLLASEPPTPGPARTPNPRPTLGSPNPDIPPEEAAEVVLDEAVQAAHGYARTQPDYAGTYIDRSGGGWVAVFQFTGDLDAHRAEIEGRLPVEIEFRLEQVRYTRAEVQTAQDLINADWEELRADGIPIVSTGLNHSNTVVIGVEGLTEDMEARLRARYGDIISVENEGGGEPPPPPSPAPGTVRLTAGDGFRFLGEAEGRAPSRHPGCHDSAGVRAALERALRAAPAT